MAIGRIPEPGTGIPESILDAKGDLISASAADTPARLAVGTNETRLVAASGETAGLKWVADTTNYAIAAKGDLLVGTAADTVGVLGVGTNGYTIVADSGETTGLKWSALPATVPANGTASVSNLEGTSSGSYTDLATSGPAVTVTTGTKALVIISCELRPDTNAAPTVGCAVSGATTQSADDDRKLRKNWGNDEYISASYATLFTGLTAGSNTFTLKYKNEGSGTASFRYRRVTVIDMGS